ncbi:MAG: FAD-dependent oxidoreductase [Alphaproteobacteria bacterium]
MKDNIPTSAKVVVIGGGIAGCSVAYHLTEFGWNDIVLLERDQLTSGTTWHAAGLLGQVGASATITKLRNYSLNLYKKLQEETGIETGLKQNGSLTVATDTDRLEELKRQATFAQRFNIQVDEVNIDKITELYPLINTKDIVGGIYIPKDGQADPIGITNVLAKAAKKNGAKLFENCPVKKILTKNGSIVGVDTIYGKIQCEYIVLATGMWSRQIASDINVSIPLYPNEHFYILSEPLDGINKSLPVLRDYNNCLYLKEDAGKILVGIFEPNAKPAFTNTYKVPDDFSFGELPEDFDHFEPYLKNAMKRVPALENVGIRKFFNGPEAFTPDTNYLLGETPEIKNFYVCCGFNSIGIQSAGGAGKVTAEWMINGETNEDIFSLDIARFEKFQSETKFITDRVTETLGNLYAMHWPYKQYKTSRNIKLLPFHRDLKNKGACFGQVSSFEKPMWYSLNEKTAKYKYSYGYQNWFDSADYETTNTRQHVGLFDLSSFAKFEIIGSNSFNDLQRLCCNEISKTNGRTTYTQMLNNRGGIVADLTVTCINENNFKIITGSEVRAHDKKHILKYISEDTKFIDNTENEACFGIFGPKSRELLSEVFGNYFSSNDFKFGTGKIIKYNGIELWFQRLSYIGELGWEIYIPINISREVYLKIISVEKKFNLVHAGAHAQDIMRMEKGFLHWGHDISPAENPFEAGLDFTVKLNKNVDFIGKNSLISKNRVKKKQFINFVLENSQPGKPLMLHDEPIYYKNKIVGETTSSNYSFNYNKNMVFGYIDIELDINDLNGSKFKVEVAKNMYEMQIQFDSLHDPKNKYTKL